jgi:hypothetical protein
VPTVLRRGPYRFFFYAGDRDEPHHIHVEREDKVAKFWLDPVRYYSSGGFSPEELVRIEKLIRKHKQALQEAWDAYFNG